jgi:hypothetical protein
MSSEEALSLSEMPQVNNKYVVRRKSLDNLLKNKYITYTEEELTSMNNKTKDEILKLDETNKKLKQELTKIVEKLNSLIKNNSELLFQDEENDTTKIINLEKIYYLRKHDHSLSIKYNKTFKQQYNALKIRDKELGTSEDLAQKILEQKNNLQKLKNENMELNRQIQEIQFENVKQTKELENSKFIVKSENNMQNYAQILNDSSIARFLYFDKIETKKKSVEKLKEQFKNVYEYVNKNKKKISELNKADMALNKINSEIEILKKDLDKTVDEIIKNCYEDKTMIFENNNTKNKNILIKSGSQQNIYGNNKISKLTKTNPLKSLPRSQSSIFTNSIPNNNNSPKKYHNIKTLKNIDSTRNSGKKNLSIFSKFKILKTNKPLKLGGSVSFKPMKNLNSMFITKEVIDFSKKSFEEKELEKEIEKIDENDFHQLIDLKGNYMDVNDRLDRDIKDKKKICSNRINQLNICIENNLIKLDKIKKTNEIMKKELEDFEKKVLEKIQGKKN